MLAHQERGARYRLRTGGHDRHAATAAAGSLDGAQERRARGRRGRRLHRAGARVGRCRRRQRHRPVPGRARRRGARCAATRRRTAPAPAEVTLADDAGHADHRQTACARSSTPSTSASPPHCAEGVGVMDKLVAITVEYMNTRKQFGATLASFQALRHRIADVKMQLELGRSMSYFASLKLGEPAAAAPARAVAGQGAAGPRRCASSASSASSCTAASASPTSTSAATTSSA